MLRSFLVWARTKRSRDSSGPRRREVHECNKNRWSLLNICWVRGNILGYLDEGFFGGGKKTLGDNGGSVAKGTKTGWLPPGRIPNGICSLFSPDLPGLLRMGSRLRKLGFHPRTGPGEAGKGRSLSALDDVLTSLFLPGIDKGSPLSQELYHLASAFSHLFYFFPSFPSVFSSPFGTRISPPHAPRPLVLLLF